MAESSSTQCKLYIGGTGELGSESGWQLVGSIEDLGEFGDVDQIISYDTLEDGRTKKLKGQADSGDMTVVVAYDSEDTGQDNLFAAAQDKGSVPYNIKIELNDQITPSTGNPTDFQFKAFVTSFRTQIGGANNEVRASVALAITSAITKIDAV